MGISDLYSVLRRHCPDQLGTCKFKDLKGFRIAIDMSIYLYKYIRTSGEYGWVDNFILLLCALKKHRIKAVCIFDGPNPPPEKALEQERRRIQTQRTIGRLTELKRIRNLIMEEYVPLSEGGTATPIEGPFRQEIQILMRAKPYEDATNWKDPLDVAESLNLIISKLERQTMPITEAYTRKAQWLVDAMGVGCIQADGEAEKVCAYLAVKGKVDAVLTEDTDVLAYGCPVMLSKLDVRTEAMTLVLYEDVLTDMEMSQDQFRDLCILLSCDYNERVKLIPHKPGKNPISIGAVRAVDLMREHGALEPLLNHVLDPTPLRHERCRELFSFRDLEAGADLIVPYNRPINEDALRRFLEENKARIGLEYIMEAWRPVAVIHSLSSD